MLYAYIDESHRVGDIYLIGALVLNRAQVDSVTNSMDDVVRSTVASHPQVPFDIELHGQQLFQRDEDWDVLRDQPGVAYSLYRRTLGRLANAGGAWFIAGVRRPSRIPQRYPYDPWSPHAIALQFALERVSDFAAARNERVTVLADQIDNQAFYEGQMRVFQDRGRTPGSQWRPRDLNCIERDFQWVDSKAHRPIQACDMLTYVYFRKMFALNPHPRTIFEAKRLSDAARPMLVEDYIWTP